MLMQPFAARRPGAVRNGGFASWITILLLTIIAVLPVGGVPEHRFVLPLLPAVAITYWVGGRGQSLSAWFVFVCGLAIDVLTDGPLGFWPLIYLVALLLGLRATGGLGRNVSQRWGRSVAVILVLALLQWVVASGYAARLLSPAPFAIAAAMACVFAPVFAWAMARFSRDTARAAWRGERGINDLGRGRMGGATDIRLTSPNRRGHIA